MENKDTNLIEDDSIENIDESILEDISPELENAEAESGIMRDYLEKKYPIIGKVRIYHPTLDVDSEVELCYVSEFNRLMLESSFPTIRKMEKILEDKGEWTQEDEDKIENITNSITNNRLTIAQIREEFKGTTNKKTSKSLLNKFKNLSSKINDSYVELASLSLKKSSLFEGTIERRAERKALILKLVRCVKRENGKMVWNSVEELGSFNGEIAKSLITDAIRFWKGVNSPLSESLLALLSGS